MNKYRNKINNQHNPHLNSHHPHLERGFIALTSMLVIAAIVLTVSVSISLLGVGEAKNSLDYKKGSETLMIAKGCAEEAMLRLKMDNTYTGTVSPMPLGNGVCTITIMGSDPDRQIQIDAEISEQVLYKKRLTLNIKLAGGSVNIVSWNEN